MTAFDILIDIAYKGERVASRRLAARQGIGEEAALRAVLAAAGAHGLDALVAERLALGAALALRAAQRKERQALALALRMRRHDGAATPWRAWFDGSAHPNPGRCGIGGVLTGPAGQRVEISQPAGHGNSSEAEYRALIAVLQAALQAGADTLTVYGDSQGVIDDAGTVDAGGAASLLALRTEAQALMARIPSVTLRWVPRHKNPEADALSQRAMAAGAAGEA